MSERQTNTKSLWYVSGDYCVYGSYHRIEIPNRNSPKPEVFGRRGFSEVRAPKGCCEFHTNSEPEQEELLGCSDKRLFGSLGQKAFGNDVFGENSESEVCVLGYECSKLGCSGTRVRS